MVKKFNEFNNISEKLSYHLDNDISILNNIFRPYSESFLSLLKEAREFHLNGLIKLSENDSVLFNETDLGTFALYEGELVPLDLPMNEALYKGREVELDKPMRSKGPKKYKVYVKDPVTNNVKVIHFGDKKGGLTAKINDPKAREAFAKRHNCAEKVKKKDAKLTAGYWSCNLPKYKNIIDTDFSGFW